MIVRTSPPNNEQIQKFAFQHSITIPEARKYLTKNYLAEELDKLKHPMLTCNGDIDLAFQRLRKVVEVLVIQVL